jgi:NDP-sugar pyrophosphorylase family protein
MNTTIPIRNFIAAFPGELHPYLDHLPWQIVTDLNQILKEIITHLDPSEFNIDKEVAIHKSAIVEQNVIFKSPVIIMKGSFVAANSYFREGVFIDNFVKVGPGTEVKSSIICSNTSLAHFNYVGNSIIGSGVNFEAGSIAANHYNEREEKEVKIFYEGKILNTGVHKFGSLVGDNSKIGANAVLSPGTVLTKDSIVKRLALIEQIK